MYCTRQGGQLQYISPHFDYPQWDSDLINRCAQRAVGVNVFSHAACLASGFVLPSVSPAVFDVLF